MVHERTWIGSNRDVDASRQILLRNDSNSLERRAQRLSKILCIETRVDYCMPNWTWQLLVEAGDCFVDGHYTGCVVSLAAGVEHGLGKLCPKHAGGLFEDLIAAAFGSGYLIDEEREALNELRLYRNDMAHSNIENLSAGVKLQVQKAVLTQSGINGGTWSEKFDPQHLHEHETAASLSAESKAGDLFLRVRKAIYDIFDRNPWEPR